MDQRDLPAIYFDGASNVRRRVTLRAGEALEIHENGAPLTAWPWDTIRRADAGGVGMRLRSRAAPELARLDIPDHADAALIAARCPALEHGAPGRVAVSRILVWSAAAAASIFAMATFGLPLIADRLAPMTPPGWEARIGDIVDGQVKALFGKKTCSSTEGDAALAKLAGALDVAGGRTLPYRPAVIDSSIPNAVALPGGRIYVFRGMIEQAETPDELAGVIAHEMGHVASRDGMRRLIQSGGTSYLLGLLFGDVTGSAAAIWLTRELLDSAYSREAETRADDFAADVLAKLGRSPEPLGELLLRVTGEKKKTPMSILASHPVSAERLARMRARNVQAKGPQILDFGEWRALKAICSAANASSPPAKSGK
jgi:predicted Zn-dependent protease